MIEKIKMIFKNKTRSEVRIGTLGKIVVGGFGRGKTNLFSSKKRAVAFVTGFALVGGTLIYLVFSAGVSQPDEADQISRINQYRTARGSNALTTSGCLTNAARAWSQHLASTGYIHHSNGSDGNGSVHAGDPGIDQLVKAHCPDQWSVAVGENVGVGNSSESLFKAFIESPSHEKNITMQANVVGVGTWKDDRGSIWMTHLFTTCNNCSPEWYSAPSGGSGSSAVTVQNGVGTAVRNDGGSWVVDGYGKVSALAPARHFGDMAGTALNKPIVGMAATPSGNGYWLVASDGGIFAFGDAPFHGSTGGQALNAPIVGMATTPSGNGYWLVASDGGIFSFGDAGFYGSLGGQALNQPIIAMQASSAGYWLLASDGGIFAFGNAGYHGSTGGQALNAPIVGFSVRTDGQGYWLVARDGGIFTFGSAGFYGSAADAGLTKPIVGIVRSADNAGYFIVQSDGTLIRYGSAEKVNGMEIYRDTYSKPNVLEAEGFYGNCATANFADGSASGGQTKYMAKNAASTCGVIPLASTTYNGSISTLSIRYRCIAGYANAHAVVKIDGTAVIDGATECRNGYINVARTGLNLASAAHSIEVRNNISAAYGFMYLDYVEVTALPVNTPPSTPAAPARISWTETTMTLYWPAATDNTGVKEYRIYRDGTHVGTTGQTSYTVSGLTAGTNYSFQIEAVDTEGAVSAKSAPASFATRPANDPLGFGYTSAWPAGVVVPPECVLMNEQGDPHTWQDNVVCANKNIGMKFSYTGALSNMDCIEILEPSDPVWATYRDNFLCVPLGSNVGYGIVWSYAGQIAGKSCVQVNESAEPAEYAWTDNYLCWSPPPGKLVGYWKFNESSGTSISDSSGGNLTGTLYNGVSRAAGRIKRVLSFDGVDDYASIPDNNRLDLGQFTVAASVYPRQVKSDWQPLVTKEDSKGTTRNYGLFIIPGTTRIHFSFQAADCATWRSYDSNASIPLNSWSRLAMTYDGVAFKFYINGVLDKTVSIASNVCNNNHPVKIGRELGIWQGYNGIVDELRIYNYALSSSELGGL